MKPGSIARRGYTKDSIRLASRSSLIRFALNVPPEANDAAAVAQKINRRHDQAPADPGLGRKFSTIAVAARANHAHVIAMVRLRNRITRNGWMNTTGVNISAAALSRISALTIHGGRSTNI